MRRVWIALAALLGFVTGFLTTFIVFITVDVRPECDGPCFHDPWWPRIAYGVGAVVATLFALAVWRLGDRYFAEPSQGRR